MKHAICKTLNATLGATAFVLFAASASADYYGHGAHYEVTVTNLTKGQVFSPPVLATHKDGVSIFTAGDPAYHELILVAEDGVGGPLAGLLEQSPRVFEAVATAQPVPPVAPPNEPVSFEIRSRGHFDRFSMVSMLVNTNDAFLGVDGVRLPRRKGASLSYYAIAYDAGSENNNQECAFVPGPACADIDPGNDRQPPGEGFIHVHRGIHEVGELSPAEYDWRNPVAKVEIKRIR